MQKTSFVTVVCPKCKEIFKLKIESLIDESKVVVSGKSSLLERARKNL